MRSAKLLESGDFVGSIEASQHCIELSCKLFYLAVGLEPPKDHDGGRDFSKVLEKLVFPSHLQYQKLSLARMRWISRMWEWAHTVALYGFKGFELSDLFERADAVTAQEYAKKAYFMAQDVFSHLKNGTIQVREDPDINSKKCTRSA